MEYVTVAQEGFYGLYHVPVKDHDPKKVVIVVGGSEGNENIPMNVGAMFARCGIAALGICYWNVDGLPKELVRVPVDPFEKAILWLKNKGHEKIIMYGISKGAELALLCASLMPDICGVVALSPMHCIWGGMYGNKSMASKTFSSASEFTYRGKDFPCMTAHLKYGPAIRNLILHQQFELSYIYEEPLKHFDEDTAIHVENIQGNILFMAMSQQTVEDVYKRQVYECGFTWEDHVRLQSALADAKGKWLVSYNDCPQIRDLYRGSEFFDFKRIHSMVQKYEAGKEFPELLIGNYDLYERERRKPHQMTLFSDPSFDYEKTLKECIISCKKKS